MELIFFIAAHMVLCLRFVTKTVLITHQCFGSCWTVLAQCQGFLCLLLWPPRALAVGWAGSWDVTQLGQLTRVNQRDIVYHMTLYSPIKLAWASRFTKMAVGWRLSGHWSAEGRWWLYHLFGPLPFPLLLFFLITFLIHSPVLLCGRE